MTLKCDLSLFKGFTEGIYAVSGGALFEFDVPTALMQLAFCPNTGGPVSVATPPSNAPQFGYTSMGGVKTSTIGTVLVLDSNSSGAPGFWICEGATSKGCAIETNYITLPSAFCSAQSSGKCNPQGIALDSHLNVYYADHSNADVVKCTFASSYQSCSIFESLSGEPYGVYRASNGDLWVTDSSCTGAVWKNGIVQYDFGDQVEGITVSNSNSLKAPHLYFATTGRCLYGFAFIYDVTDHQIITPSGSPFSGPGDIPAISTKLQFTTGSLVKVYFATDKI